VDIDGRLDDVHMATTTAAPPRFRTVTGAGTIMALILVLAFGNAPTATGSTTTPAPTTPAGSSCAN
jgi:hypothetical protein